MSEPTVNYFHQLQPGSRPPARINAFIEIPAGGRNKYEYNRKHGALQLDRVLHESVFYPTDYGFIPQTWGEEEEDPLDIMVHSTHPTFPGCVIECRPVGIFKMLDNQRRDYKIIAVPTSDPRLKHIKTPNDINPHFKTEVENFWNNYCRSQPQKEIEIVGWGSVGEAYREIERSIKNYQKKFANPKK